jgi:hypothetical protein
MESINRVLTMVLVIILLMGMTACGKAANTENPTDNTSASGQTVVVAEPPESKVNVESLMGNWVQADDETKFANITKTDSGYQYEDNDGKYFYVT